MSSASDPSFSHVLFSNLRRAKILVRRSLAKKKRQLSLERIPARKSQDFIPVFFSLPSFLHFKRLEANFLQLGWFMRILDQHSVFSAYFCHSSNKIYCYDFWFYFLLLFIFHLGIYSCLWNYFKNIFKKGVIFFFVLLILVRLFLPLGKVFHLSGSLTTFSGHIFLLLASSSHLF